MQRKRCRQLWYAFTAERVESPAVVGVSVKGRSLEDEFFESSSQNWCKLAEVRCIIVNSLLAYCPTAFGGHQPRLSTE
jgi:hypothetical protein